MKPPLVTVAIPSYNHAAYIQASIRSIIEQDYLNIELIVIDDGSRDDSVAQIKALIPICQQRFTRFEFRHRPNQGLCATLNEALAWAEGEYFSPFASDDIALPNKISFLSEKIQQNSFLAVFGKTAGIGEQPKARSLKQMSKHRFSDLLHHRNMPATPTALIQTAAIRAVGGYAPDVKMEDWYMWLKLTEHGEELASFPQLLAYYRRHENNITNDKSLIQEERRRIVNKFKSYPEYSSAIRSLELIAARDYEKTDSCKAYQHLKQYGLWRPKAIPTLIKLVRSKLKSAT